MAINNIERYLEGLIIAVADEKGPDCWWDVALIREKVNEQAKDEAWTSLSPPQRIWKIMEICTVLSKKKILTPGKRRQGSIFYSKRPVELASLKHR